MLKFSISVVGGRLWQLAVSIACILHQRLRPCMANDPWPSRSINTHIRILQTYVT
jgi:hypothetical protein